MTGNLPDDQNINVSNSFSHLSLYPDPEQTFAGPANISGAEHTTLLADPNTVPIQGDPYHSQDDMANLDPALYYYQAQAHGFTDPSQQHNDPSQNQGYYEGQGYGEGEEGSSQPDDEDDGDDDEDDDDDDDDEDLPPGKLACGWQDCPRTFDKEFDRTKHMRNHTRPLTCDICFKGKPQKKDLDRHMWSKHPDEARHRKTPKDEVVCSFPGCKHKGRSDNVTRHMRSRHGHPKRKNKKDGSSRDKSPKEKKRKSKLR